VPVRYGPPLLPLRFCVAGKSASALSATFSGGESLRRFGGEGAIRLSPSQRNQSIVTGYYSP
jgi:hypothetical protein